MASWGPISSVSAGRFWRITALTSVSMRSSSAGVSGAPWLKSKRMRSPSTKLALLGHVRAEHMLQRRVRQV